MFLGCKFGFSTNLSKFPSLHGQEIFMKFVKENLAV